MESQLDLVRLDSGGAERQRKALLQRLELLGLGLAPAAFVGEELDVRGPHPSMIELPEVDERSGRVALIVERAGRQLHLGDASSSDVTRDASVCRKVPQRLVGRNPPVTVSQQPNQKRTAAAHLLKAHPHDLQLLGVRLALAGRVDSPPQVDQLDGDAISLRPQTRLHVGNHHAAQVIPFPLHVVERAGQEDWLDVPGGEDSAHERRPGPDYTLGALFPPDSAPEFGHSRECDVRRATG